MFSGMKWEPLFAVCCLARLLADRSHILIGTNAAPHMAAALLAKTLSPNDMRVTIIGSVKHSFFSDDFDEVFNCATRGVFDSFVVGGGQIDGQGNINLVGVGTHPQLGVRWPGSHGTPLLYLMIPNIVIFRDEHTRRVMVPKVDFISAPGVSAAEVFRPGGPSALLSNLGLFSFDRSSARFKLVSIHPGSSLKDIEANTGFEFERSAELTITAGPSEKEADALVRSVCREVGELYPQFASKLGEDANRFLAHHGG